MKKCLSIIIFIILICIGGCTQEVETSDENNITETVVGNDVTGTAAWPTNAWSTSSPEEQGIDPNLLNNADMRIHENYPNIYSLLVIRHGYLVHEKYYQGMDENSANPVFSVTKSIMSALTGIAMEEKLIDDVDQKISEFIPEYFEQIDNIKKNEITIENVLTMTGGLESVDTSFSSYYVSKDWLSYALKKPLANNPGEKFIYNTGLTHFLSGIISETSHMKTKDFADKFLFNPIGISVDMWESDQKGNNGGGFGLSMKPVDMARFGYLYLNNGLWDGKQIIPKEWIKESTQKQISVDANKDYGYLFWIQTILDKAHNKEVFTYRAEGYAGQIIMIIPEFDMVVVITANEWKSSNDNTATSDVITDYIIPAVK